MKRFDRSIVRFLGWLLVVGQWTLPCTGAEPPATRNATPLAPEALRQKQDAQERARLMARALVQRVLEVQVQQLEENGLQGLPLFRDIQSMRKNIDGLVDREMQQVVDLLANAQEMQKEARVKEFVRARKMIRDIAIRLSIERQNLSRRLRNAELVAQTRKLILQQTRVRTVTESLPEQPQSRQESMTLAAIQDQHDVHAVFERLHRTLTDVSEWDGPVGEGAADGLRILKAAGVEGDLTSAASQLETSGFTDATRHQSSVIKGLGHLLERLERTQGVVEQNNDEALKLVKELTKRQEAIREQTKEANLKEAVAEKLAEAEQAIHKDLAQLDAALRDLPAATPLLEQARAAALEAANDLFEARKDQAMADEAKVLGNLAQIEEQLKRDQESDQSDKSAEELHQAVAQLEKAKEKLTEAAKSQESANKAVEKNPNEAKAAEEQVKQTANDLAKEGNVPAAVQTKLESLASAAEAAVMADMKTDPSAAGERQKAAEEATASLEDARREVNTALADLKRQEQAVKIGELARAAEALERAAASEREIAAQASDAAKEDGLDKSEAAELASEQADVNAVTEKVKQGIEKLAPTAAATLADAAAEGKNAQSSADQAGHQKAGESKKLAEETAKHAAKAAEKLAQAARQTREAVAQAARELGKEANAQLAQVAPARQAASDVASEAPPSLAERLKNLEEASDVVAKAQAQQDRASGHPEAARAREMLRKLEQVAQAQDDADRAAEMLAQGRLASPASAAAEQQQVADAAEALANLGKSEANSDSSDASNQGDSEIETGLHEAAQAAQEAAKATLDNKPATAQDARLKVDAALAKARAAAEAQQAKAANLPTSKADAAAQRAVSELAAEAEKLAGQDAPAAAASLDKAEQSSNAAADAAEKNGPDVSQAAREQAAAALEKARQQIADAQRALATEQHAALEKAEAMASAAADQVAAVDPAAAAALDAAGVGNDDQMPAGRDESPASKALTPESLPNARDAEAAVENFERNVRRAEAMLAARETRLQRDVALADAIEKMSKELDAGAEAIGRERDAFEKLAGALNPGVPPAPDSSREVLKASSTLAARQAAARLADAANRFAEAQRATGQAAEEASGQQEVANPPLREALELAANLSTGNVPDVAMPEESAATGEPGSQPTDQSSPPQANNTPEAPHGTGQKANERGRAMGTQFVPSSPDVTARMMAGPEGSAAIAAHFNDLPVGDVAQMAAADEAIPATEVPPEQGPPETSTETGAQASQDGTPKDNSPTKDGKPTDDTAVAKEKQSNAGNSTDSERAAVKRDDAWFAKLPPELRKAMQAQAQRRPPRGYEERLRRYFENADR